MSWARRGPSPGPAPWAPRGPSPGPKPWAPGPGPVDRRHVQLEDSIAADTKAKEEAEAEIVIIMIG